VRFHPPKRNVLVVRVRAEKVDEPCALPDGLDKNAGGLPELVNAAFWIASEGGA